MKVHFGRRRFMKDGALVGGAAALGPTVVFAQNAPSGWKPVGGEQTEQIPGKDGLVILNSRPWNAEVPAHLLNDKVTPTARMFIRNNGIPPPMESIDVSRWTLGIAGESCKTPKSYTLQDLRKRFRPESKQLVLECGGNGRSEFFPPARGNQWTTGAVGCPIWTGVRLRDILDDCGVKQDAVYVGYMGADIHLSGDPEKKSISRGVPIAKAMEDESLVAWAMNGKDMHWMNGHPLRLVFGGWPASASGKWLQRLLIRNRIHDGAKMGGFSYRVPKNPVAPGTNVPKEDMEIIEAMPIKSLLTSPRSGISHPQSQPLKVSGHAWVGEGDVQKVDVSIDFGSTWAEAKLEHPVNRFAWQSFSASIRFPQVGYYEIWARAEDSKGHGQPMVVPGWNPKGYLNNACHRIAVQVL
jgi:DMSO/TMAO reductase YedYZ molybdopterin-dependent catalytic subunit